MAEFVESACDICGQKHRISEERLGVTITCKVCDTEFTAEEYVPPPEDDQAGADDPLPWIKGAGVAVLILFSLGGLGRLLVYHPDPGARPQMAATRSSARVTYASVNRPASAPSAVPQPIRPTTGLPAAGDTSVLNPVRLPRAENFPPVPHGRPQIPDFGLPDTPHGPTARTPPEGPAATPPVPGSGQVPGFPPPGFPPPGVPRPPNAMPSGPTVPQPPNVPRPPRKLVPLTPQPVPPPIKPPVITGWSPLEKPPGVRLTGRDFTGAKVHTFTFTNRFSTTVVSETALDAWPLVPPPSVPLVLLVINNAGAMVAYSDDLEIIDSPTTLESMSSRPPFFYVGKGGHLTNAPPGAFVLADEGGRVDCDRFLARCIIKKGATVNCDSVHNAWVENGCSLNTRAPVHPQVCPVITFIRLPSFAKP